MDINWRERIKKGMLEYAKKWAVPFTEENVMGFIKQCQKAQGYPLFTPLDEFYRCSCFGGEPITPGTIYFKDVPKDVADVLTVTVDRYDWLAHYFKTGKLAPHSSNIIIVLDPSKENLERVEVQIKEASPDEQEKLRIFINNTRRTLGMPDYEDETSELPEELKYLWEEELIDVGGQILPDETVWLYHATTKEIAKEILRTKILKTAPEAPKEYGIYAGSNPSVGFDYGDGTVVPIRVHAKDLELDDIFPGRHADFMIEATRYKPIQIGEVFNVREILPKELIKKYPQTKSWVKDFYPEFRYKSIASSKNEILKVPGEKEALELVKYHEREWKRLTKGINLRDFDWTREMLKKSVFNYNQLQRLKPYGSYFYLSPEGVIEERETESRIEQSREATYKIKLSAKGLLTKNIEDLTLAEAKKYYEAITKEIVEIKKQIEERKKKDIPFSLLSDDLFRAKERCALALRVIGELSEGVIPQTMLREYEKILWDPTKSKQNSDTEEKKPGQLELSQHILEAMKFLERDYGLDISSDELVSYVADITGADEILIKRTIGKMEKEGILEAPKGLQWGVRRTEKLINNEEDTEGVMEEKAKEPWMMTYKEFFDIAGSEYTAGERFGVPTKNRVPINPETGYSIKGATPEERIHRAVLMKALKEGKPVPKEVLKDYPELVEKPPEVKENLPKTTKLGDGEPISLRDKLQLAFLEEEG